MSTLSILILSLVLPASAKQEPTGGPSTLIAPRTPQQAQGTTALGAFDAVMVAGDIALNLHGDAQAATAELDCPTRSGPGIQMHVKGDTLMVTPMHEEQRTSGHCTLTLRAPTVERLQLSGASKVRAGAMSKLAEVNVGGAANLDLRGLTAPSFSLNISGAGRAQLSGAVDDLQVTIAGAAEIDAKGLVARNGHLTTHGAGNIEATVKQSVKATSAGAGTIVVHGSPAKVQQTTAGVGRVVIK